MTTLLSKTRPSLLLNEILPINVSRRLPKAMWGHINRISGMELINTMYQDLPVCDSPRDFLDEALAHLGVEIEISSADRERIPKGGKLIVVANHPFGGLDGLALLHLLESVRSDVRMLANQALERVPEIRSFLMYLNILNGVKPKVENASTLRQALNWLESGRTLALFPSGDVSHFCGVRVQDSPWRTTAVRLARRTGAPVLPIYFPGGNSLWFQLAGMIHPMIRTGLLPRELLNKRNTVLPIRVGIPIHPDELKNFNSDMEATKFLHDRVYHLADRRYCRDLKMKKKNKNVNVSVVEPVSGESIQEELKGLDVSSRIIQSGDLEVWIVEPDLTPSLLQEIGRLREITFRAVGEGSGRARDLDFFDAIYEHLILWNKVKKELVGAYRVGATDRLLERYGVDGLYTSTLFRYSEATLKTISPALELGRAFVRIEYQKSYLPLLLLWKGIAKIVSMRPHYRRLFGAVSISDEYQQRSRDLIVTFLRRHASEERLSLQISPRTPVWISPLNEIMDRGRTCHGHIDQIEPWVKSLEPDGAGVPILIKQYLKLGGKLISTHRDEKFSNTIDALLLVDLVATDPKILARYMGAEQTRDFIEYHARRELNQSTTLHSHPYKE